MFHIEENDKILNFTFSSEMKLVDRVIREVSEFASDYRNDELSSLKLIIRELLINAIEHGNKNIKNKLVKFSVAKLDQRRFKVISEDQGDGFDHSSVKLNLSEDPQAVRRRGFPLINTLADGIEFNEKGNLVTAYLTIDAETYFEHIDDNGVQRIRASGNITAACADRLKKLLQELLAKGSVNFLFDLEKVTDIDSIGLSIMVVLSRRINSAEKNHSLELINVSADIKKLFIMTQLDRLYKIV